MPQEDYGLKELPLAGSKLFQGIHALDGADGVFVAVAGENLREVDGNDVADQSTHLTTTSGAGETIGNTDDTAASSNDGTFSLIALFKRFMLAHGALGDAAATSDGNSTLMSFIRGIVGLLNDRLPIGAAHDAADAGNPLKIGGKAVDGTPTPVSNGDRVNTWHDLYGQVHTQDDTLAAVLGQTGDLAIAPDNSGSLSAKARMISKVLGDTTDAAVSTDANGTASAKLRGLIVLFVNLLSRWPASLGQKTMAASFPVVLSSDQTVIPASQSGSWSTTALSGVTDDAAAAGQIYPVGGIYYGFGTVDEIDAGDAGRGRISIRRALIASPDFAAVQVSGSSVTSVRDLTYATSYQGAYATPTTANLSWTAGTGDTRYYRVPMGFSNFRRASIGLVNSLDVPLTLTVRLWVSGGTNSADQFNQFSTTVAAGDSLNLQGQPQGEGSSTLKYCPGLNDVPATFLVVVIDPTGNVTADGSITLWFGRSS